MTLGEYPQAGEAQYHLASARDPVDGICLTVGKRRAPCHEVDVAPCEKKTYPQRCAVRNRYNPPASLRESASMFTVLLQRGGMKS